MTRQLNSVFSASIQLSLIACLLTSHLCHANESNSNVSSKLNSKAESIEFFKALEFQESPTLIPTSVKASLEHHQIPLEAISIAVMEIMPDKSGKHIGKTLLAWQAKIAKNPASTMKVLTTLSSLDILGPRYRWSTNFYTDGHIHQNTRTLVGNLYLQGGGDPKLVPEEFSKVMRKLHSQGIWRIDGDLFFDRSAYAPSVMEQISIDGESQRAYNVNPDPLLYAFKTISFRLHPSPHSNTVDISYTPTLSQLKIINQIEVTNHSCDNWKDNIQLHLNQETSSNPKANSKESAEWTAIFSGNLSQNCPTVNYNVAALDSNAFLMQSFKAAWEESGGTWAHNPTGKDAAVPMGAQLLVKHQGISLGDDVQDINKFSNNVMARQLLLTLALEKMGKPATTNQGELVVKNWLKSLGLQFPGLVIENGSGLSRNEMITAEQMNQLLLTARNLPAAEIFYNSLPIAGTDGTMRHRLINQLRKFLHLKIKPEARIKTGSLADVRAIAGYVISKSGKMYAVSSFINHPLAKQGLEAHDQLLTWLLEDGPHQDESQNQDKPHQHSGRRGEPTH